MTIKDWSSDPGSNTSSPPFGAPEAHNASDSNNIDRQIMADVRLHAEDGGWLDRSDSPSYATATSFTVSTDLTAVYIVGRRLRAVGGTTGTIYGSVSAVSFADPTTTVTVVWDDTGLVNEALAISVGVETLAGALFGKTVEEDNTTVTISDASFPSGDVRRYGLVSGDTGAATTNTAQLQALLDPTVTDGYVGPVIFESDSNYELNDIIPIRKGIQIRGNGSKLRFNKSYVSADDFSGFLYAVEDFELTDIELDIDYDGSAGSAAGSAVKLGNRTTAGTHFQPVFDASLTEPWGNIKLRNVKITTNNPSNPVIEMLGGLRDISMENVRIDGGAVANRGITYEFGFATDNVDPTLRESSHLNNLALKNIRIANLDTTDSIALRLAGAYNCSIDGLYLKDIQEGVNCTPGEALFFRPWANTDEAGAKRNMAFRNVVIQGNTATGMTLAGAQSVTGGYLNAHSPPLDNIDQVDLYDFLVDGFSIEPSSTVGITTSGGKVEFKNGVIRGATFALQLTDECTQFLISNVNAFDTTSTLAFRLNFGSPIFGTERKKTGVIENCFIAGTGGGAIAIDHAESVTVRNCRFGYENAHDEQVESNQTSAISVGADAHVIADSNFVAANIGANEYTGLSGGEGILINPRGFRTASVHWSLNGVRMGARNLNAAVTLTVGVDDEFIRSTTALTANRVTTLSTTDAIEGSHFRITHTGGGAFTLDIGGEKTIPISTDAFVDVHYDTAWHLTGYGVL